MRVLVFGIILGFLFKSADVHAQDETEVLQRASSKKYFFKTVRSVAEPDIVTRINVFEKKSGKLVQYFSVDCQALDEQSVAVDDYNFDGFPDFSIHESSYAGSNTSRLYFLYNQDTGKFFDSGFTGISLSFNHKTKTITETNRCCAGSQETRTTYKLANNKMKLLKKHCYVWDEQKQRMVERELGKCD